MPNHVHVLIKLMDGVPLGKVVQSWKSYTGRRIAGMMGNCRAGAQRSQGKKLAWKMNNMLKRILIVYSCLGWAAIQFSLGNKDLANDE
jgi:REP element-mobilizing transposase RayT